MVSSISNEPLVERMNFTAEVAFFLLVTPVLTPSSSASFAAGN